MGARLSPGIYRRIAGFARPYRRQLIVLLVLIGVDATVSAANPLIYRAIIDDGALAGQPDVVVRLAFLLAGLALVDTVNSLAQRWITARVGEGLIFDLRTAVFVHVQRMPIAFFTRTQTGAMLSRLNNDVLDAQQAFTSTLSSVVGNVVGVVITIAAMAYLSWQITLVALVVLPLMLLPMRWVGTRIRGITRESYELNARLTSTMAERFNVAGALLVRVAHVHAHLVVHLGDAQLFLEIHGRAGRLLAITQGGIEYYYPVRIGLDAHGRAPNICDVSLRWNEHPLNTAAPYAI